jgi:hypothetical protein
MNLKKSLKSRLGQSVVEYLLLFLIVAVLSVTLVGKVPVMFSSFVSQCMGMMQ